MWSFQFYTVMENDQCYFNNFRNLLYTFNKKGYYVLYSLLCVSVASFTLSFHKYRKTDKLDSFETQLVLLVSNTYVLDDSFSALQCNADVCKDWN